jgi:hypothetical protein
MTDIAGLPDYDPPQGPIPETGEIEIKLVRTNVFIRWPCSVCGGVTEKDEVLAEGPGGLRVCDLCLKDGDMLARFEEHHAGRCAQTAPRAPPPRGLEKTCGPVGQVMNVHHFALLCGTSL